MSGELIQADQLSDDATRETGGVTLALEHAEQIHAVESDDAHETVGEILVNLQTAKRRLEGLRDYQMEPVREANRNLTEARRRINQLYQPWIDKIVGAAQGLDKKLIGYRDAKRRKAQEEAERQRAAQAVLQAEAEERRLKEAAELSAKGLEGEATQILDAIEAEPAPAPIVYEPPPMAKGTHVKKTHKARVVDFGKLPDQWKLPNQKALDDFAKNTSGAVPIPGAEFYPEEKTVARKR